MKSNKFIITEKELNYINSISNSKKFIPYIRKLNPNFNKFSIFIDSFEIHINKKLNYSNTDLNRFEDIVFESIISRLELLGKYKKLCIRIYLESQKNNLNFITLSNHIKQYFSQFTSDLSQRSFLIVLYILVFQTWIEDNESLDKSMSFIGKANDFYKRFESLLR